MATHKRALQNALKLSKQSYPKTKESKQPASECSTTSPLESREFLPMTCPSQKLVNNTQPQSSQSEVPNAVDTYSLYQEPETNNNLVEFAQKTQVLTAMTPNESCLTSLSTQISLKDSSIANTKTKLNQSQTSDSKKTQTHPFQNKQSLNVKQTQTSQNNLGTEKSLTQSQNFTVVSTANSQKQESKKKNSQTQAKEQITLNSPSSYVSSTKQTFNDMQTSNEKEPYKYTIPVFPQKIIPFKTIMTSSCPKTYCKPCRLAIEANDLSEHASSVQHRANFAVWKNILVKENRTMYYHQDKLGANSEKILDCNVCKIKVPNNYTSITDHLSAINHKSKFNRLLQEKFINKNDKKKHKFLCIFCTTNMGTKGTLVFHIQKAHPFVVFDELKSNHIKCRICNISVFDYTESKIYHDSSPEHMDCENKFIVDLFTANVPQHHYNETYSDQKLTCKVCKEDVFINESVRHLESGKHILNHKFILETNKLVKINLNSSLNLYDCQYCNVDLVIDEDMIHIKDRKHIEKKIDTGLKCSSLETIRM